MAVLAKPVDKQNTSKGYKLENSTVCVYSNISMAQKELLYQSHQQINLNYIGINLTKQMRHLNDENYKTLKKEIENRQTKYGVFCQ